METSEDSIVSSNENVARILASDWIVDGEIQHTAFMLRPAETYISVNRPAIETFANDIASFISCHPNYCVSGTSDSYNAAILNVGDIRAIDVEHEGKVIDINVEVEPREIHTKSHAGIFTRFHSENIKNGKILKYGPTAEDISADMILLDVRYQLLSLSTLEQHKLAVDPNQNR